MSSSSHIIIISEGRSGLMGRDRHSHRRVRRPDSHRGPQGIVVDGRAEFCTRRNDKRAAWRKLSSTFRDFAAVDESRDGATCEAQSKTPRDTPLRLLDSVTFLRDA